MKKKIALAFTMIMPLLLAVPVLAHDGWSQTNAPIIAPGEVSYVELLLGNHSNEHRSYRIEGQWSTDSSKVFVTTPAGQKADITSTRFYTGEPATESTSALNNGFIASFSSSSPGAYIITVEGDSIFKHGDTASRTLRSAKSFVAVSDIPTVERVKALQGFSRIILSDRAELIPTFNPAAVTPNETVSVQLLLKGEPLADTDISIIQRSNSESVTLTTDEQGMVSFTTGEADYYLVRAKPSTDESSEGEYETMNYEATMTFTVQNGIAALPRHAARQASPYVYLNGQLIQDSGALLKDGTTYVNAAWFKEHISENFEGEGGILLRQSAEDAGAVVEFLPAVGATPAAVIIYSQP